MNFNITLQTGGDDLRSDCYANLTVILTDGSSQLYRRFVNGALDNNTTRVCNFPSNPPITDYRTIRSFTITDVSVENGLENQDNWNLDHVQVILGRTVVAEAGPMRFTEQSRDFHFDALPPLN